MRLTPPRTDIFDKIVFLLECKTFRHLIMEPFSKTIFTDCLHFSSEFSKVRKPEVQTVLRIRNTNIFPI